MANMSYCRFRNTLNDLIDCFDHFDDKDLDLSEQNARWRLYELCQDIVKSYGRDELKTDSLNNED